MMATLLPADVAVAEAFADVSSDTLFPQEEVLVRNAVEQRRREFATGRHCARTALARLGYPPMPLLPGPNREPRWPSGVVGSITHCAGYRAAAVARATALTTIGLDAEPNQPLPDGVLDLVALPAEREWLSHYRDLDASVCWDRLLFSAKESVFKAWFPLARRWLGFEEAVISVDREAATFAAHLLVPGPSLDRGGALTGFAGRFLVGRGLVLTATAQPVLADLS